MARAELVDNHWEQELRQALASTEASARGLEERRRRLVHVLASGNLDRAMYRQIHDELVSALEAEQARVADLRKTIAALPDIAARRATLEQLAGAFGLLLEQGEPAEVSAALQQAGIRVYVENGQVEQIALG